MILTNEGCKKLLGPSLGVPLSIFLIPGNQGMCTSFPISAEEGDSSWEENSSGLIVLLPCHSRDHWEPGFLHP